MVKTSDTQPGRTYIASLIEKTILGSVTGLVAGALGAYMGLAIGQARMEEKIANLANTDTAIKIEAEKIEDRMTKQIKEGDNALLTRIDKNEVAIDRVRSEVYSIRLKVR